MYKNVHLMTHSGSLIRDHNIQTVNTPMVHWMRVYDKYYATISIVLDKSVQKLEPKLKYAFEFSGTF